MDSGYLMLNCMIMSINYSLKGGESNYFDYIIKID